MNIKKFSLLVVAALFVFTACKKDDDGVDVPVIEIRDRAQQQDDDMDSINEYLKSHYYNKSHFTGNSDPRIADLIITEITDEVISPEADSLLINVVGAPKTTRYADIDYEFYAWNLSAGGGKSPSFADNIRVIYEGSLLDGTVFDVTFSPVDFDLAGDLISGWKKGFPLFSAAQDFEINGDGTVNYINPGVGVMFLPSGLAYFSDSRPGATYAPLVFKFELYQTFVNDHDNDGIPSFIEDIDQNGELDDNTDGDISSVTRLPLYDFVDADDDNDGIPTRDELESITYTINTNIGEVEPDFDGSMVEFVQSRTETNGIITIKTKKLVDSNGDDKWDYLDDTIKIRNSND
ncbi:FKBP-type peptidyl-prolyl cis-trans isomerase [Tamlana crocina]